MVSQALIEREEVKEQEKREIGLQIRVGGCAEKGLSPAPACGVCVFALWQGGFFAFNVTRSTMMECERRVLDAWRVRRAVEGGEEG